MLRRAADLACRDVQSLRNCWRLFKAIYEALQAGADRTPGGQIHFAPINLLRIMYIMLNHAI
jgi:hypothetical protein